MVLAYDQIVPREQMMAHIIFVICHLAKYVKDESKNKDNEVRKGEGEGSVC